MAESKSKIGMVSLGCPKNQVDAEILLGDLKQHGFLLTPEVSAADAVIVNTCGFIESAKQEAIEQILEICALKEEGAVKAVIITGCLAERYREEIMAEFPLVDAVVGIGANGSISEIVSSALDGRRESYFAEKTCLPLSGERVMTTMPFMAYLKIAEGCDNCCSYCAIPSIRGRFRSRPLDEVVSEAKELAGRGVKELILVAQDCTRYGEDLYGEYKLADLLAELCEIDSIKWIRVLYCYPERITDELLDVMADQEKIVKYIDLPVQHINDDILKAMNRRGGRKTVEDAIKRTRERIPGVTLRTTLIAGFPGETKQQFEELVEFVKEAKFERLGCFPFSKEDGTAAANMKGQVSQKAKDRRAEIIMLEQSVINEQKNKKQIGRILTVLVEGYDRFGECYFGRTEADAPEIDGKLFFISDKKPCSGDFVKVLVTDVLDYDLMGEQVTD